MGLKEKREEMTALVRELQTLHGMESRSVEQEARIDEIIVRMNVLGPEITRLHNVEQALTAGVSEYLQASGERKSAAGDGAETRTVDTRSPMQMFLESREYKAALENPRSTSGKVEIGSFHTRQRGGGALVEFADDKPLSASDMRALITSGTASASFLQPDVYPTIYRENEAALTMRDVLANGRTNSDSIVILQESGFTNNAAEVAEATAVNGVGLTGGVKPESALTFTEAAFPVRWIAHWVPITRQMLEDLPFMESYVEERLRTGIKRRENAQILNGNGVAPNLTGILNTSGIQDADTAVYFAANPVKNAGTDTENFERILRAKSLVRLVGRAQATFVVMNPADYEVMQTTADLNGHYYAGGPFAAGGVPTLWGLPVVEEEEMAAGTALVGDGLMASVVDRHDARIYTTDSHSDFFIRNILVTLAEERLALPVFRPAAFVAVELV